MNGRGFITISMHELERVKIIEVVVQHRLTIVLAAERLQLCERQVSRLVRRYEAAGPAGLVSARRGQPGNRELPVDLRARAMSLVSRDAAQRAARRGARRVLRRAVARGRQCAGGPCTATRAGSLYGRGRLSRRPAASRARRPAGSHGRHARGAGVARPRSQARRRDSRRGTAALGSRPAVVRRTPATARYRARTPLGRVAADRGRHPGRDRATDDPRAVRRHGAGRRRAAGARRTWLPRGERVYDLIAPGGVKGDAYVGENDVARRKAGQFAVFVASLPELATRTRRIDAIDKINVATLDAPSVASTYGGPIPAGQDAKTHQLVPLQATWQVRFGDCDSAAGIGREVNGTVQLGADRQSFVGKGIRFVVAVLQREVGF